MQARGQSRSRHNRTRNQRGRVLLQRPSHRLKLMLLKVLGPSAMIPARRSGPGRLCLPSIRKPSIWLLAALSFFTQVALGEALPNTKEIL